MELKSVLIFGLACFVLKNCNGLNDMDENCSIWAHEDGECLNNPGYMLVECANSCAFLPDIDENCQAYADEHRCSTDKDQISILLNCPQSCGFTYQWNPFARERMGISDINRSEDHLLFSPIFRSKFLNLIKNYEKIDKNIMHSHVCQYAAVTLHQALQTYFAGDFSSPLLNPENVPGEFNLISGLGEALLTSVRNGNKALGIILATSGKEADNADMEHVREAAEVFAVVDSDVTYLLNNEEMDWLQRLLVVLTDKLDEGMHILSTHLSKLEDEQNLEVQGPVPPRLEEQDTANFTVLLSNEYPMPLLGFGTWQLVGEECYLSVKEALQTGYRHIDTAEAYDNGEDVGRAIKDSGVPRADIFLASKLSDERHLGYEATKKEIKRHLDELGTEYLDLYMLHSPFDNSRKVDGSWRAMDELNKQGILRSIGVSNFDQLELQDFIKRNQAGSKPMVVQNKFSIYNQGNQINNSGEDLLNYCRSNGIVLVGYSSLSSWPYVLTPTQDPHVEAIAAKFGKTPGQVLIRWQLQLGVGVIPRSSNPGRIAQNFEVFDFELDTESMKILSSLNWLIASNLQIPTSENYLGFHGYPIEDFEDIHDHDEL